MRSILAIVAFIVTLPSAQAYMSPTEVFPDLDVSAQEEERTIEQSSSSSAETAATPSSETSSTTSETTSTSTPSQAQPQSKAPPPSSSSAASDVGTPIFYRSGEEIVPTKESGQTRKSSIPTSVFEQSSSVSSISSSTPEAVESESSTGAVLEPAVPEEESASEEASEEAAPQESFFISMMRQMKYIIGAIGLLIAGAVLFMMRKQKSTPTSKATERAPNTPVAPEASGPQMVEESSERLQHALDSMGEADDSDTEGGAQAPPEK